MHDDQGLLSKAFIVLLGMCTLQYVYNRCRDGTVEDEI